MLGMKLLHNFGLIHGGLRLVNVFSMNIIEFKLRMLGKVDLFRVKISRLRAELDQSLPALTCRMVKSALQRGMYSRLQWFSSRSRSVCPLLEGQIHQKGLGSCQ
jgi:hypothetical protein